MTMRTPTYIQGTNKHGDHDVEKIKYRGCLKKTKKTPENDEGVKMQKKCITWYPSRPLSVSSGTSSVKRLFCGGLAGAAGGETLGGAAAEGGKRIGGARVCTKDENNSIVWLLICLL